MKNNHSQNNCSYTYSNKLNSPNTADGELTRIMYETDNNGFFNMSQVLATSEN